MSELTSLINRVRNDDQYQTLEVGQDYDASLDAVIVHPTANPSLFLVSCRAKQCQATDCNELASKVCARMIGEDKDLVVQAIDDMRFHDDKKGTYGVSTTVEVTLLNQNPAAESHAADSPIAQEDISDDHAIKA